MRVLQYAAAGKPEIINLPVPEPAPHEVLVRVEGISTCPQWDLHIMDGVPMFEGRPLNYPYVPGEPGHEFVGVVERCGSSSNTLPVGSRVAAWRDPGGRTQGCYAEFVCVDEDHILVVPASLEIEAIAPLELAMCVQVSFDQLEEVSGVRGKSICISGLGPAGLIAVQMARAYGATEITCIEPHADRRALAMTLGADVVTSPGEITNNTVTFDTGLDTTGLKPVIENLIALSRSNVAIFGVLRERIEFGPEKWWGNFKLMGYGEHNKEAGQRALKLIEEGGLQLAPLISKTCSFESYADAVESLRNKDAIKVLVLPG